MIPSYEDSCGNRVEVSEDHLPVVNDLIRSLPHRLQRTIDVKTPCEKYPNTPTGTIVEDMEGNVLYFHPYVPALLTPYPLDAVKANKAVMESLEKMRMTYRVTSMDRPDEEETP